MTRPSVVLVTALIGTLLAACGDREPGQGPAVEVVSETDVRSELTVAEFRAEIARLERECVPAKGVSRESVEKRFGEGDPSVVSKVPTAVPADSPYRMYEFCEDGVLGVRYDADWKVLFANFHDPYSTKGRPIGQSLEQLELRHELGRRLVQMRRIRDEYRRRFGESSRGPQAAAAD